MERFNRLCHLLRCTPLELCTLCCIYDKSHLEWWRKQNRIPPWASLHFALIESAFMGAVHKVTMPPIMPIDLLAK